jgi:septum formation protein
MHIFLASASPRRQALLSQISVPFSVVASTFVEAAQADDGQSVAELAEQNALGKARGALPLSQPGFCVGADTVVLCEDRVMGKPRSVEDAKEMLHALSGRVHKVVSGVAVVDSHGQFVTGHAVTEVSFRVLTAEEITAYVSTGEPLDKAGAYGIQGKGALFVNEVRGCYFNVMGLPLSLMANLLSSRFGINLTDMWR